MSNFDIEFVSKNCRKSTEIIPFPIEEISDQNSNKYNGYLSGICIELDYPTNSTLIENGSYGIAKNFPIIENSKLKTKYIKKELKSNDSLEQIIDTKTKIILSLTEAFYLHYTLKCLTINTGTKELSTDKLWEAFCKINRNFVSLFVVYSFYTSKNWIVKGGMKFGGDYLLYKYGPRYYHASFLVFIQSNINIKSGDLQRIYRTAENTGKDVILVDVHYPSCHPHEYLKYISQFKISETNIKRFVLNVEREQNNI